MSYNPKLNEKVNKLQRLFTGCVVCGKSITYPFKTVKHDKVLRCKAHQRELKEIWYDNYLDYIKAFRGQV